MGRAIGDEVRVTGGGQVKQGLLGHDEDLEQYSVGGFKQDRKEFRSDQMVLSNPTGCCMDMDHKERSGEPRKRLS